MLRLVLVSVAFFNVLDASTTQGPVDAASSIAPDVNTPPGAEASTQFSSYDYDEDDMSPGGEWQLQRCNKNEETACNVEGLERCTLIRERAPRCVCLTGFIRSPTGSECQAVTVYRGMFRVLNLYGDILEDRTSSQYRRLEYNAREALFNAVVASRLRTIVTDVIIRDFNDHRFVQLNNLNNRRLEIEFEFHIAREFAPDAETVKEDLIMGLTDIQAARRGGNNGIRFLNTTTIYTNVNGINRVSVTEPNPCDDNLLNYCSVDAVCTRTSRSFRCQCREGYDDVSPTPLRAPGEVCRPRCGCRNDGECQVGDAGRLYCKCPSWYLGTRCEIDGQVLLIVVSCLLGALFITGIVIAACYFHRAKGARFPRGRHFDEVSRAETVRTYPSMDYWKYYTYDNAAYPYHSPKHVYDTNSALTVAPYRGGMNAYPPMSLPRVHTWSHPRPLQSPMSIKDTNWSWEKY